MRVPAYSPYAVAEHTVGLILTLNRKLHCRMFAPHTESDPVRKRAEKWLSSFQGSIGYQIQDLEITIGNDGAFCHFLYQVSGTLIDGGEINMWVRATIHFRQIDGKWMIIHEHQSVTFDGETGRASLDLTNK